MAGPRGEMAPVTEVDDVATAMSDGALSGASIQSYLGQREETAYLLVNKRSGVTVERGDVSETYEPASGARAFALLTDIRVVIAVSSVDGGDDQVVSIPLVSVSGVETESSLFGGSLELVTTTGEQWSFPCRGDLDAPREYIESVAQLWRRAQGFTGEVDEALGDATEHLAATESDAALDSLSEAESTIARGHSELQKRPHGEGIAEHAGLDRRRRSVRHLRRRAYTQRGETANARAQNHWNHGEYGTAADELRTAREAYEQALALDGPRPTDEDLEERLAILSWHIEDLRRTPLANAVIAFSDARATEESLWRVQRLEKALTKYRDLLALSWGPNAGFEGDSEEIRTRIDRIVTDILSARVDLARRAISTADQLTGRGATEASLAACDVAEAHLDAASDIASELAPDRSDEIETCKRELSEQRTRIETAETDRSPDAHATESPARSDDETASVADADSEPSDERDEMATDTEAFGGPSSDRPESPDVLPRLDAALRSFDEDEFTMFVGNVWRTMGWSTSLATASVYQYDVMANTDRPVALQALIRTVHNPEEPVGEPDVDRCASDFERTDIPVLVTTGTISDSARERAADRGVKLLDCDDLVDLLVSEGLLDLLDL